MASEREGGRSEGGREEGVKRDGERAGERETRRERKGRREGRRGEGFRKVTTMYSSLHHVFVCHCSRQNIIICFR